MSVANTKRLQINLEKLQKAHDNLTRTLSRQRDEDYAELLASRFRLCFELTWRLARRVLVAQGVDFEENTMRILLETAQHVGLLPSSPAWVEMISDRNTLTHEYDEPDFKAICKKIEQNYLALLTQARESLENAIKKLNT